MMLLFILILNRGHAFIDLEKEGGMEEGRREGETEIKREKN